MNSLVTFFLFLGGWFQQRVQNYYFFNWLFRLFLVGGAILLVGRTPLESFFLWAPLGGVILFGGLWGFNLLPRRGAGLISWWISLGGFLVVGSLCWSHWGNPTGVVSGGLLLDSVGLPYVFLTVSLLPVVVLASLDPIRKNQPLYYFWVLFLGAILVLCFCVQDLFLFYVLFEILGFPMFLLIGQYGPRPQRVGASYKFFIYTFGGSAFILPVLVYLQFWVGSTEVFFLRGYQFTEYEQALFFGLCAVPFGVKIPLVPLHLWLPEAHVEAPTPISMLLAGLLLKTGGYAFIRFLLPVFPWGGYVWGPFLTGVALFGVVFASLYALVQVDMKRMIAYASVAHMSVVFLGILTGTPGGSLGGTYLMLAHGYTSAGLFAGIGVLYDRYHTRTVRYYGGLAGVMPVFGVCFFLLTLSNLSFPFTGGFTGEFMILVSLGKHNLLVCFLTGGTVFLSLIYSVWLFNRIFYGGVTPSVRAHQEVTPPEVAVLGWCVFFSVGLGFTGGYFVGLTQECYEYTLQGFLP